MRPCAGRPCAALQALRTWLCACGARAALWQAMPGSMGGARRRGSVGAAARAHACGRLCCAWGGLRCKGAGMRVCERRRSATSSSLSCVDRASFVACVEREGVLSSAVWVRTARLPIARMGPAGANLPFGSSPNRPLGAVKTASGRWGVHLGEATTPGSGRPWVGSFLGQTKVHLPAGFSCTPSPSPDRHARGLGP